MPGKSILILGGTRDAVDLAVVLEQAGFAVTTSLAGVTRDPRLPAGALRVGGFGGAAAMADYIREQGFAAVVDATHPFAARISANGCEAASLAGIPLVRLERPAWRPQPGDNWQSVASVEAAVAALPSKARALLTVGRKALPLFMARAEIGGVARMIEPPEVPLAAGWTLLLARPPFALEDEKQLMSLEGISHLVTKNAGGELTAAKLAAARALSLPVIMIERPAKPKALWFWDSAAVLNFLAANI